MWAAGDVVEVPHGLSMLPIRGLTGSHAYAQGRTAAFNAAGRDLVYDPVWVPWGMVAGDYTIGGFSIGETLATAMGVPYVVAKGVGVSRARYFPGATRTHVKLLAEPDTLQLIGGQIHGGEGVKERADFLAFAAKRGATLEDLAWMENIYSPPIGALFEPIAIAAQNGLAELRQASARHERARHEAPPARALRALPAAGAVRATSAPASPGTVKPVPRPRRACSGGCSSCPLYRRLPWALKQRAMATLRMTATGWTPPERRPARAVAPAALAESRSTRLPAAHHPQVLE